MIIKFKIFEGDIKTVEQGVKSWLDKCNGDAGYSQLSKPKIQVLSTSQSQNNNHITLSVFYTE